MYQPERKPLLGSVTTDAHFHMQYADASFFHYFGDDVIYSILRTVHEADTERLLRAAERLRDGQMEQQVIRMRGCMTDWRWMLVCLTAHGEGEQRQYRLRISDAMVMQRQMMDLLKENSNYRFYLNLMRELAFEYSFRTKHIRILAFDCCRESVLTDMQLSEWKEQAIREEMIDSYDIPKLEKLCQDIETGTCRFRYEMETSLCSMGSRMEYCRFQGVTRSDAPGERIVLGTISFLHAKDKTTEPGWYLEANRDPATDLLNKNAITAHANSVLASRPEGLVSLVILNVDEFKGINDRYGHLFGDEVLFTLSHILKTEIGERGVAGRIGGGMFLLILQGIADETDLRGILRAIRTKFEWAWENQETAARKRPHVTCSMGAACYPIDADNYELLFSQADKALYIASEKGNNRYVIYDIQKHGEVIPNRERSVADLYATVPTQSKAGFIADLVRLLPSDTPPDVSDIICRIGAQFGVDGIQIFTSPDWKAAHSWGHPVAGTAEVMLAEPFIRTFQEDGVCVVDNINALEGVADEAYAWFAGEGIQGTVLYRVDRAGKPAALIAFSYFGRFRKWSTLDVNHLTVLGGILAGLLDKAE